MGSVPPTPGRGHHLILNASGCLDALAAPHVARQLDAYVTKTVTPLAREGNEPVRIAETDVGMLNSIGLANPGIEVSIDIDTTTLTLPDGRNVKFPLEGFARYCLLNGVDELGFLLGQDAAIEAYEQARR